MTGTFDFYRSLEGLSKERRRVEMVSHAAFLSNRFHLSPLPEVRKLFRNFCAQGRVFMQQHPDTVAIGVFGSSVKGYANESSDIDACLFVDIRKISREDRPWHSLIGDEEFCSERVGEFMNACGGIAHPEEVYRVIFFDGWTTAYIDRRLVGALSKLFLPCLGTEIRRYRRELIHALRKMPHERRESYWSEIMKNLWFYENNGYPEANREERKRFYAIPFAEAERIFG